MEEQYQAYTGNLYFRCGVDFIGILSYINCDFNFLIRTCGYHIK